MSISESAAMEQVASLQDYLSGCEIVQVDDPLIQELASRLRNAPGGLQVAEAEVGGAEFARAAFEHVRDRVAHSFDADDPRVAVTSREVHEAGVGLCYAKSHLLAAVLRAGGIPTALCYQWLAEDDRFMLHGLVAVHLGGRWHRQDARGNKPGVDAQFSAGAEQLAWPVRLELGERDLATLYVEPPASLIRLLRSVDDIRTLATTGLDLLPDGPSLSR